MKIGITTTVPIEIIYASGHIPCDLNNLFITGKNPLAAIQHAELKSFPRNICAWIKGIYSIAKKHHIKRVIGVTGGDCSNTCAMMERMKLEGIHVIPFAYPFDKDPTILKIEMEKLIKTLKTSWEKVQKTKKEFDAIRHYVHEIDRLTWEQNKVSGFENHLWQVSTSDFNMCPNKFKLDCQKFINTAKKRKPKKKKIRLGYIGVPPIIADLYNHLDHLDGQIVFNEVQRQFSMPNPTNDMIEQYLTYTYPYDIFSKINDIKQEIKKRNIKAIIHYVQNFCFRKIEDDIYRKELDIPILTLECDLPGTLSARDKTRIEVFMEMLKQ